ncbi:MAG: VOC family protein [Pseudomonadota bacterium]
MITALDHLVLLCPDIEEGVEAYTILLGTDPVWQSEGEGATSALFSVSNTKIELLAPSGGGMVADKLSQMLLHGPKLTSLVYRSDDLTEDHRLFGRRGLAPSDIQDGESEDVKTQANRSWRRFRLPDDQMAGVKSFVLEPNEGDLPLPKVFPGSVTALDHLVINTPNPERAVATYGARLGLRFALDRTAEQWKTRFLFFRLGGLTLEIIHRLDQGHDRDGNDTIWGITWAVNDLEAARERLSEQGLNVSDIRTGRKPGSRVFTVRDGTLQVPTLFIQHDRT